ncbi:MAG: TetR/AcrR family transcriptional regulator [Novosphingobium sp.]|nr:TetR/AcrR family transcriptional regulator [Novosphingobium sp.]MCP5401562.1 TetR/AcrR family transcriptional regulator [Novosphingobium sp.]
MPRRERYRHLLEAARRLVEGGGAASLTISALTKEAGVSRPVVYEHFENSEAIAVALIEDYFENIVDLVDRRTRGAQTLDEYLARAIAAEFEYHGSDNLLVRNLTNGHATGKRLNEAFLQLRQRSVETFSELLRQQGVAEGVAQVGGYVLAELVPNAVHEFATQSNRDLAQETLVAMVTGAVHAIMPSATAQPTTPEQVLQASREMRQARERLHSRPSRFGGKGSDGQLNE